MAWGKLCAGVRNLCPLNHARLVMKCRELPPLEILEANLKYDPDTGIFYKIRKTKKHYKHTTRPEAGCKRDDGYIFIGLGGKCYHAARLAWKMFYKTDPPTDMEIDHINRQRDDNRIVNLRLVTSVGNNRNQGMRRNNTSGVKGVSWSKQANKWHVLIYGQHLGFYADKEEAAKVAEEFYAANDS
jgi:hypothetical protein